jgi:hypothetical protein
MKDDEITMLGVHVILGIGAGVNIGFWINSAAGGYIGGFVASIYFIRYCMNKVRDARNNPSTD